MYHKLIKWLYLSHFSVKNQGQCRLNELIPCRIDFLTWQVTSKWRISHFISRVNIHAYLYMIPLPLRLLKIIIYPRLCVELTKEYTAKERGTILYYARYLIVKQTILGQFLRGKMQVIEQNVCEQNLLKHPTRDFLLDGFIFLVFTRLFPRRV